MKYLSICSGIEAASVAFEPLGWRPLAFSEIEAFPRAVLKHHYPDTPCHGDFTLLKDEPWIVDADMLCGGTPCFPAGHMVLTSTGYVPIEDVRTGDMVMTHAGRMRRVLRHGTKMATVGTLKAVGMPEGLVCTEDHPFRSVQYRNQSTKRNGVYAKIEHVGTPEWTPAKDMPGKQWCALLNYDASNHTPKSSKFHERECMYLAGFYLGDGWVRRWNGKKKMAVVFGINNAKYELLKPWLQGVKHTITNERTTIKVTICDTKLATWLSSQFGEGSHTKRIPAWVLGHRYRRELMRGYIDTDGAVHGGCLTINSVSRSLAYGACDLLNAEGYVASVSLVKTNSTTIIEGRTVNQADYFSVRAYRRTSSRKSREHHGMLLRKVTGYERGILSVPVFNIEVEEDNSYILDGAIVHNCQAFSAAGNRQSLADDRGNLTLQFVLLADAIDHLRSTAGREPAWILWENVPGVLSTNDNAFGAFLGGLVGRTAPIPEPEGGWTGAGVVDGPTRCAAWRVLNAEHFGLAQRRKRVFVLARGGAGRWAVADALLPIIESSRWHPAPSRGAGKGVASTITSGAANGGPAHGARSGSAKEGNLIPEVTRPLTAAMGTNWNGNGDLESSLIPSVAHTMRGEGFGASEDGTGRGSPLVMATGQASAMSAPTIDMAPTLSCNHEAPILMRMREGKEGGGKSPLVSDDMSLTLATANDQVLAYSPKIDTLQAKGIDHASTYEADASSALSTLLEKVGAEAYAQWGLGILGAFQSPEVLRAWLHGESLRQSTDETRPRLVNGAPSREESVAGEVLRKVWFDGPDGRTSQGRGLAKQLAGKPCEALSVLPHEGAPDETDMQVVRQAREGSRLLRQALSEIEAARRSEQVGVADQAEMHDAGMRPDEPRARAMQQARATTEEGNTGTATANQVTSGDGSLGPQMMVRRLLPVECERLQGFPPGYTNITYRGKPAADGNKYKALGNSWAVPVVRWIGKQINQVRNARLNG